MFCNLAINKNFRKEKKYPLTKFEFFLLKEKFTKYNLKKIYPSRLIYSTYFDNEFLRCFHESSEGLLPRKKYRIRSYPRQSENEFYLEKKISSVEGSYKESSKITVNQCNTFFNHGIIDKDYGKVYPVIDVFYERSYFLKDNIRITLDTKINYKKFNKKSFKEDNQYIVELKSDYFLKDDDFLKMIEITNKRFSKYCNGIELLNLK